MQIIEVERRILMSHSILREYPCGQLTYWVFRDAILAVERLETGAKSGEVVEIDVVAAASGSLR